MDSHELYTLAGVIIALAAHLVIITGKISRFMGETVADINSLHRSIEDLRHTLKEVGMLCKDCTLRKEVQKIEDHQQELKDEFADEFKSIRVEIRNDINELRDEMKRMNLELASIKVKLQG